MKGRVAAKAGALFRFYNMSAAYCVTDVVQVGYDTQYEAHAFLLTELSESISAFATAICNIGL